jgi:hypothetical protein
MTRQTNFSDEVIPPLLSGLGLDLVTSKSAGFEAEKLKFILMQKYIVLEFKEYLFT